MTASNTKVSNKYAFNLLGTLRKADYKTQHILLNITTQLHQNPLGTKDTNIQCFQCKYSFRSWPLRLLLAATALHNSSLQPLIIPI